jgi:hypothetical protein
LPIHGTQSFIPRSFRHAFVGELVQSTGSDCVLADQNSRDKAVAGPPHKRDTELPEPFLVEATEMDDTGQPIGSSGARRDRWEIFSPSALPLIRLLSFDLHHFDSAVKFLDECVNLIVDQLTIGEVFSRERINHGPSTVVFNA